MPHKLASILELPLTLTSTFNCYMTLDASIFKNLLLNAIKVIKLSIPDKPIFAYIYYKLM